MKLTELTLLSLQTAFMKKDPTTRALCGALDGELKNTVEGVYRILMYHQLNTVGDTEFGHALVDELAWQFHCDYYDATADIETKKAIVKNSIKIHQTKGTPKAVEDLLSTAFPAGTTLSEWFEYGGEPYHFKVETSSLNTVDMDAFLRALNSVKNARSYLEAIEVFTTEYFKVSGAFKNNREIEYRVMPVGDYDTFVFGDGTALAFGVNESLYAFDDKGTSGIAYTLSDDGTYYICTSRGDSKGKDIIIVSRLNGIPVKEIGEHALQSYVNLESVVIGNGVTSIGREAFDYCTELKSVTIPSSVTSITFWAFGGCKSLTDVYYKGTEEQWNAIDIGSNDYLTNATIHYNS